MTTKDIVYLGLIALGALVAYCHGFFSGVSRSRRIYESLLGDAEQASEGWTEPCPPPRHSRMPPLSPPNRGSELRGDFGNN